MHKENAIENNIKTMWKELTDVDTIEEIVELSEHKTQIIYKHSHRCGVCLISKEEVEKLSEEILKGADLYLIHVIPQRALSNAISQRLEIRHESPQIIILEAGVVKWKGSHWDVTASNLEKHLS